MSSLFFLQLLTSFFVGGVFIALLSFVAERVPQRTAGLILSLPSTQAIALFFMGWILGPESIQEAFPVIPLSLSISLLFVTAYVYLAQWRLPSVQSVLFAASGGLLLWLVLALPLAYYGFQSISLSLIGYLILTSISYYFLAVRPATETTPVHIHYTAAQKILRAVIAGGLTAFIVFLSKQLGPLWGGIFSIFPAAYVSSLLLLHLKHGGKFLFHVARNLPLASPTFIVYPLVAMFTFTWWGVVTGSVVSYLSAILYLCAVGYVQKSIATKRRASSSLPPGGG